jgi:glycosyltransferase involved in cell wall biosynthesis
MRILFASGHPHIPQLYGGGQANSHELIQALIADGHDVAMLCGLNGKGFLSLKDRFLMKMRGRKAIADHDLGYPVFRGWFVWEALEEACETFKPDVVFCQAGFPVRIAAECNRLGLPAVIYLHNVEDDDIGGNPGELHDVRFIANSTFTAERLHQQYGLESTVVPPFFNQNYYTTQTNYERVVFINPHPHKGAHVALDVAELCIDIPFLFVESWTLDDDWREELNTRLAWLPNVELLPPENDMKKVYARARFLMIPSRWEEAWGRVASEAHFSGIPVIASKRGGLPEAVGPGGILIPPKAPASDWAKAVRQLWTDEGYWLSLSLAAQAHAQRDALNNVQQLKRILSVLNGTLEQSIPGGHIAAA